MRRLILNGEVAVDHAQPAQARNSDRHLRVGDGIHRRRNNGGAQSNAFREPGGGICGRGNNISVSGKKQNVVVGEAGEAEGVF